MSFSFSYPVYLSIVEGFICLEGSVWVRPLKDLSTLLVGSPCAAESDGVFSEGTSASFQLRPKKALHVTFDSVLPPMDSPYYLQSLADRCQRVRDDLTLV